MLITPPTRSFASLAGLCCAMSLGMPAAYAQDERAQQPAAASQVDTTRPPSPGRERLELGIALDSDVGPVGSVYFGKNNLLPGVFTYASVRYAHETQRGQAGLFKPDALGKNIHAGLDIYYRRDAYDKQGYHQTTQGIEPYIQFQNPDGGTLITGLGYRGTTINDISADAPKSFFDDRGTNEGPYARVSYTLPRALQAGNFKLDLGVDNYAYNLGTSHALWTAEAWARAKVDKLPGGLSLGNTLRAGTLHSLSGHPPQLADRFFIGGATLRGFAFRRMGPIDGNYFMGGERYATASFDLSKQVGTVLGSPVSVGAFVDIGSLWHLNRQVDTTADRNSVIRSSAGLTLTFTVAGAPVSLYVAKPIKKAPRDEEQNFGMSISLRL